MNDSRTVGDFVWWVKRTVSNAVLHARAPQTIKDVYERAQVELNSSLKTVMGDLDPMDDNQLRVLEGYIYRTSERRSNIRAGKLDVAEDLKAQEHDDEKLKAAFSNDWDDLI